MNRAKQKLRDGGTVLVFNPNFPSPSLIESAAAIENLPAIVTVEGVDAVVVGLSDLASSLGHPGENRHPDVRRAAERIIAIVGDVLEAPRAPRRKRDDVEPFKSLNRAT